MMINQSSVRLYDLVNIEKIVVCMKFFNELKLCHLFTVKSSILWLLFVI